MTHVEIDDMEFSKETDASFEGLIGHELNDLNSGMLASLDEHPLQIDIHGNKTWIKYTIIQTVNSDKTREFLKALC